MTLFCVVTSQHTCRHWMKFVHCIKYARIWVFSDPYSPLHGRIRVSENPYFRIFYAVVAKKMLWNTTTKIKQLIWKFLMVNALKLVQGWNVGKGEISRKVHIRSVNQQILRGVDREKNSGNEKGLIKIPPALLSLKC